ncbi:MAG: hypothetical protein AAGH19_10270 [Pseudomonadota bacterium]
MGKATQHLLELFSAKKPVGHICLTALLAFSFALFPVRDAEAVRLSSNGQGEALIFPYYGVLNGNTTLLNISSSDDTPKALKVNLRDKDGAVALSFNQYLEGDGSRAAALSREGDEAKITLADDSCTFPSLGDEVTTIPGGVLSGYIEVIEMGTVPNSGLSELANLIRAGDCAALAERWESGAWASDPSAGLEPPLGGVWGSASIINVAEGTQYGMPTTGLVRFSNIVQHTPPGESTPNLGSAHDEGTPEGRTAGTRCIRNLDCRTLFWASPLDAVAHALLVFRRHGQFSTETEVSAQAEFVLTLPLRRLFLEEERLPFPNLVGFEAFDRMGTGGDRPSTCLPIAEIPPCGTPYDFLPEQMVNIMAIGTNPDKQSVEVNSPILGEPSRLTVPKNRFTDEVIDSGAIHLHFSRNFNDLESTDGEFSIGRPVLVTVLQKVSNGQLVNEQGQRVLANYGTAEAAIP